MFLGVLALGLPAASLAGDPGFRLDVLAASVAALEEGGEEPPLANDPGSPVDVGFARELTRAALALDEKGIIALGAPPGINVTLLGGIAGEEGWRGVDFAGTPRIFDRFLAHACLESLLATPTVHAYLMRKYGDGSEVWQRLMREGYASGPGP